MEIHYENLNWLTIAVCTVIGQVFLTIWFAVLFADPWAKAYGVADKTQHTKEVPVWTYGVGLICVLLLTIGLATLQRGLGIQGYMGGLLFGLLVAVHFCVATALPGYAFLRRWNAFFLAIGSQGVLILIISTILAAWQ